MTTSDAQQMDPRDETKTRTQPTLGPAIVKGITKRNREAANEAARIQALMAGEVFAPMTVRREPKTPPAPTLDQPPSPESQDLKNNSRAQACSDAKREVMRSIAIRSPLDEHPQFPGRHRNWSPNRRQRRNLEKQGLL